MVPCAGVTAVAVQYRVFLVSFVWSHGIVGNSETYGILLAAVVVATECKVIFSFVLDY